ncbi:hypothetical protein [Rubrivivax sp. JA1055]|nr:hypothetical protein [Rubrivivax sp. JA1055]MCC9598020.1 hypothetical protein [Rubrivivax sp. JA1055]
MSMTARRLAALAAAASLAACGGGGVGDPANPETPSEPGSASTAAVCYDAQLGDSPGSSFRVAFRSFSEGDSETLDYVDVGSVAGPVDFNGHQAYETTVTTFFGTPEAVTGVYRYYGRRTGTAERTDYGLTYGTDADTVFTTLPEEPPVVDTTYALEPGQSVALHYSHTPNLRVTFKGIEQITVPAGTYQACRLQLDSTTPDYSNTHWLLVGTGVLIKEVQTSPGDADWTAEATAIEVNGRRP